MPGDAVLRFAIEDRPGGGIDAGVAGQGTIVIVDRKLRGAQQARRQDAVVDYREQVIGGSGGGEALEFGEAGEIGKSPRFRPSFLAGRPHCRMWPPASGRAF